MDKALTYLDELIKDGITKHDLYMLQSAAYLQKGDKKGVESSLKNGIEKNPKSTLLYLSLADFYVREKQVDDAVSVVQKIIVLEPKEMRHKLTLAGLYWDSGKEEQATEVLKNLILADEKNEEQWVQNAGFFVSRNKIDRCREDPQGRTPEEFKESKNPFCLERSLCQHKPCR